MKHHIIVTVELQRFVKTRFLKESLWRFWTSTIWQLMRRGDVSLVCGTERILEVNHKSLGRCRDGCPCGGEK